MPYDDYDGVVYDLDGTLVDLAVDWDATEAEVAELYRTAGRNPDGRGLWDLLTDADDPDFADRVEETIATRERVGARESSRLGLADELRQSSIPAGVCSLNCEAACRIALDRHDLIEFVDGVVGRDTVERPKPDPQPLLATVERIGVAPDRVVFVGDSPRDADCARRAGVDFEYVEDRPDPS